MLLLIECWNYELKYRIDKKAENVVWPLAVGNNWVYHGYQSPEYYIEVIKTEKLKGDEVYIVDISSKSEHYYQHFKNKEGGLFSYGVLGRQFFLEYGMFASPVLVFKYPGIAGESYELGKGERMTIKSTNEKVTVPAGSFRCYKYYYERPNGYSVVWQAPNIGIVKEFGSVSLEGTDHYYRLLLKSYNLNN